MLCDLGLLHFLWTKLQATIKMKNHTFRVDHYAKKAKTQGFLTRAAYKLVEIDKKYKLFSTGQSCLDLGACPGSWMQYVMKRVTKTGFVIGIDLNPINEQQIKNDILEKLAQKERRLQRLQRMRSKSISSKSNSNQDDDYWNEFGEDEDDSDGEDINNSNDNNDYHPTGTSIKSKCITFPNIHCIQRDIFEWDYLSELDVLRLQNREFSKQNDGNRLYNLQCIDHGFHHILSDMAPNISGMKALDNERSYELWKQSLLLSTILGRFNSNLVIKGFQSEEMKTFLGEMRAHYKYVKTFKPDASRDSSNEIYIVGRGLKNKRPHFTLQHAEGLNINDIEDESVQKLFNLWDYIKLQQQEAENDQIRDAIREKRARTTPKVDVSKSELLSRLK